MASEGAKERIINFNLGFEGILKCRNRIVVPKDEGLKKKILEEAHHSKYTVYPDSGKIYRDLRGLYW